jgi:cytochrome c1
MTMRKIVLIALAVAVAPLAALAATDGKTPEHVEWSFAGPFGTYDRNQLKRGFQVYKEVCAACHGLELVAFRNLADPGGPEFSEAEAKALAAAIEVPAIDNDTGEAVTRKGILADHFPSPFPNDIAAKAANAGAVPPDLSLVAKGRHHGPDYLHSLIVGYQEPPAGVTVPAGTYYNPYMPGGVIAMPPPLTDGQVEYAEANVQRTVDQYAKDVSAFLMWAADPKMEARKRTGLGVVIFLSILSVLLFLSYRRVWHNVDH